MKINQIIEVNKQNNISAVQTSNLSTVFVCKASEIQGDETDVLFSFNTLLEVQQVLPAEVEGVKPGIELAAMAQAFYSNGGGQLQVFACKDDQTGNTIFNDLLKVIKYFDVAIYSKSIVISDIDVLAASVQASNKIFAYTANEDEYETMYNKLNHSNVCLSFATKATQAANKINSYLFAAVSAIYGGINRSDNNSSINISFYKPVGFLVNSDLTSELRTKLETNKTLHVDSTRISESISTPFFIGSLMSDRVSNITATLNYIALQNQLQVTSFNLISRNLSYNPTGFSKVITACSQVLNQYSNNGSLSSWLSLL